MKQIINNFFRNFSAIIPYRCEEEETFDTIWLNIAKDFNSAFNKIKEEYEERN